MIIIREKLVRLSNFEYKQVEKAREELTKKGIDNLPEIKSLCPECGKPLKNFKFSYNHLECLHCGYTEKNVKFTVIGTFALGTIIGLGAAALIYLLTHDKDKKEEN